MKEPKSRIDKIRLLQAISTGKTSISRLQPSRYELWNEYEGEPGRLINDETGEEITAAEFLRRAETAIKTVRFVIQELPKRRKYEQK